MSIQHEITPSTPTIGEQIVDMYTALARADIAKRAYGQRPQGFEQLLNERLNVDRENLTHEAISILPESELAVVGKTALQTLVDSAERLASHAEATQENARLSEELLLFMQELVGRSVTVTALDETGTPPILYHGLRSVFGGNGRKYMTSLTSRLIRGAFMPHLPHTLSLADRFSFEYKVRVTDDQTGLPLVGITVED